MTQTTFDRKLEEHCSAVLAVLKTAHVACVRHPEGDAADALVMLRPTLNAWQVPQHDQRRIEQELREEPERYHLRVVWAGIPCVPPVWRWVAFLPLHELATRFMCRGRHPVCITFWRWQLEVMCAISRHGYYDPATNHTPPPSQELNALERREHGRDLMNALIPGIGDALSGRRPSTEEGRRLLWHRGIDPETGEVQMINDADLPEEEDDDDADH